MLVAIIEDKNSNVWSQLFLNKNQDKLYYDGFSVSNGKMSEFRREYLNIFNAFLLSDFCHKVDSIDGYDVLYDDKNKFYHFFKDGKEDYNKFFIYNSEPATLSVSMNSGNSLLRKFFITVVGISLVIDVSFGVYVLGNANREKEKIETVSMGQYTESLRDSFIGPISYYYEFLEKEYRSLSCAMKIRSLIYESSNLVDVEKDFFYNEELINVAASYYVGTNFETIAYYRNTDLRIESFSDEEMDGYYEYDNKIHIKNYDVNDITNKTDQYHTAGHEYVHLLQVLSCPTFIKEASAEVMTHEFFLKSADMSEPYSYPLACKYLKVLMEIVGPEVILESNFKLYSESLSEAVKNYLTEEEYNEFIDILKLSPYYHFKQLSEGKFDRLEELLSILYNNKFGTSMEDNDMITAILSGKDYNRPYFSESLKNSSPSYYLSKDYVNAEDVSVVELSDFIQEKIVTEEEFSPGIYTPGISKRIYVVPLIEVEKLDTLLNGNNKIGGTVTLKDGTVIGALDAQSKGIIRVEYHVIRKVSEEEFLENYKTNKEYKCKIKIFVPTIDDELLNSDSLDGKISLK